MQKSITVLLWSETTLCPRPTLGPQHHVHRRDGAACPAWLTNGMRGDGMRLPGMVSWHFTAFPFPMDRNLTALEGMTVSLLLHTHVLLGSTIRNPKPMFCYIYFSHWAFTVISKSCEETSFNRISFIVKENLHQKWPKE